MTRGDAESIHLPWKRIQISPATLLDINLSCLAEFLRRWMKKEVTGLV